MKWRNLVIMALFFLTVGTLNAQHLRPTFAQTKEEILKESADRQKRVADYLQTSGLQPSFHLSDGRTAYMVDVIEGKPVYMAVFNEDASRNVGVDDIRSGGTLGLNLTGEGLRLLVWDDPSGSRITHQEFDGRLSNGNDVTAEGGHFHSTHVSGTILGSGVNADAKGMAPMANGVAYGFDNDIAEMTTEVGNNPASTILSNHSYGLVLGWDFNGEEWNWFGNEDVSTEEDYRFGFYSAGSRSLDQIARDAPNYLIVFAAGNNRNDTGDGASTSPPPDGPYDLIPAQITAKNILVVGATRKLNGTYSGPASVEMASFSDWGPTDDGRIKPDISAPGVSIRSAGASSDDNYLTLQGTSFSAPVVTGGLALIQELNMKLRGQFMTSAALRALTIHTALETGRADGPDYEYGWGLFNAKGMAEFLVEENDINKDLIIADLADGETDTYTITPEVGTDVKITLAWTDVPGAVPAVSLDPEDIILVNDLDMRATGETDTQEPWIMNPSAPADAATKGDNFRDNVEKIEFTAVDGSYTININHKNSIEEGPQEYALIIEYVDADAGRNMYWVGDNGDWNDPSNWSFSSGGRVADAVPTAADRVFFDDNSFDGLGAEEAFNISLQANVEVAGLRWFAVKQGSIAFDNNQITVGGDLVVLGSGVSFGPGNVVVNGDSEGLLNPGSALSGGDLLVNAGENGRYTIVGDVNVNSIEVQSGELVLNNRTITAGTVSLNGGSMSVTNSDINITGSFSATDAHTITSFTDSRLIAPAEAQNVSFDFGAATVPVNVSVSGTGTTMTGTGINDLTINSSVNFTSDLSVEALQMAAATTANIADGTTLTVQGDVELTGISNDPVQFTSAGTGSLNLVGHRKVCVDFLSIQGVNYTGESTLSIGENSIVAGAETGWNQANCDNTLFADFGFDFGCANGLTQFNNLSSGQITGQSWNFGESGDGVVDSEELNPSHSYGTAGVYDIKLTVSDANANFELTRRSQIIENTLAQFGVDEPVDGVLVSSVTAQSYQWYRNGVALSGIAATNRQLQVTESGIYSVLISDETCNRFSDEFTFQVTSIDVDPEEQEKVDEAVNVFPNPTRDYIDVTIEGYTLKKVAMELVDQSGKIVTSSLHDNINSQSFSERLKVSDMRQGFYILRFVVNENIIVNRKVILTD